MSHALVTVICSIPQTRVEEVRRLIDELGNPATESTRARIESLRTDDENLAIHFSSMTVFPATRGGGHLVFEFSGDGSADLLFRSLAKHLGDRLEPVFSHAEDRGTGKLEEYWRSHEVKVGHGYFDNPGLVFAGTPGLSVRRIKQEQALANHVAELIDQTNTTSTPALELLAKTRRALAADPQWTWAVTPEPVEALQPERTLSAALPRIVASAGKVFAWPFAIPLVAVFVITLLMDLSFDGLMDALSATWTALKWTLLVTLLMTAWGYMTLRRMEEGENPEDVAPDPSAVARAVERENHAAQNHLAAVSVMKPGVIRKLTLRLVLAAVFEAATKISRPGWLGSLGTIHFARWVTVPGTGDLLFLSNYGGSWESYLEDFITKAHNGLTGVWSNTQGFPKATNLIQDGATNGARFKRWARRQQVPTGFWYTAYPDITTAHIRNNAAIRQGIGAILTDEEANRWLALFGSQARPASAMEVHQIQSIAFGGLGFLRCGMAVGFRLSDDQAAAQRWLADLMPLIAFGDGRKHERGAVILGLAAPSLPKLGLHHDSIRTFPQAFLDGMCAPWRSRILGDEYANAPDKWQWGNPKNAVDGLLLLYDSSEDELAAFRGNIVRGLSSFGHEAVVEIPFVPLPDKNSSPSKRGPGVEPFGFVDGVSQPIIRGTYKSLRGADPIHIVEAGEFILGYPDNRGHLPATPVLAAKHDPGNVLPIAAGPQAGFAHPIVNEPRDVGRNGTFLAVRQLNQDVQTFSAYCVAAAEKIKARFPEWLGVDEEFVGAKLIGRWKDGSSLVRFPYRSATEDNGERGPMIRTAAGTSGATVDSASGAATQQSALPQQPPAPEAVSAARSNSIRPDNDFLFGAEDPQGLRCPFGAHIRRANPRESFDPGSNAQLTITNRHRILRVGRLYKLDERPNAGLFFMCLNSDLERQFEFIQQTWIQKPAFHGLTSERDPLLGNRRDSNETDFTIPTRDGPARLRDLPEFVTTEGGGYFFVPGKRLLEYLSENAEGH